MNEPLRTQHPRVLAERVCRDNCFRDLAEASRHFVALEQPDVVWREILTSNERMLSRPRERA
jgi:hypothetical protein